MAIFDIKTYLSVAGNARSGAANLATGVATSFGVPSCMLNMAATLLNLLPTSILGTMRREVSNGKDRADDVIKGVLAKLRWLTGIIEFDTDSGTFKFVSDCARDGMDCNEGEDTTNLGGILDAIENAAQFAGRLYTVAENTYNQVQDIKRCLKQFKDFLDHKGGNGYKQREKLFQANPNEYALKIESQYRGDKLNVNNALQFIEKANKLIDNIGIIIAERFFNPELEPVFQSGYSLILSGTTLAVEIFNPLDSSSIGSNNGSNNGSNSVDSEVFRLVYGMPKTREGQFLFSKDGIYFDSQVSGITPALLQIDRKSKKLAESNFWKFEQDPNLGGRGKGFSTKQLDLYVNTILDPASIDNSIALQNYYDKDGFLQNLIGERNKLIYDLSANITALEKASQSQSIIYNFKQALISEDAVNQEKINKRRKQIELAVKLPVIYKGTSLYSPGTIPVNDFTYLGGLNITIDLQKQRALALSQVDIAGSVMPIKLPIFSVPQIINPYSNTDHLIVTDIGEGAIIHDGGSSKISLSPSANTMEITPEITISELYAMYNFLDTYLESTNSLNYTLRNYASETNKDYAQLISPNLESLFNKGLGIPYLHGITKNASVSVSSPSSVGSFVKLPESTDFTDLLYHRKGSTIDFWVNVPGLAFTTANTSSNWSFNGASGLSRIILANENVGVTGPLSSSTRFEAKYFDKSDSVVNGFVMGFTRDKRISLGQPASNDNTAQSKVSFFLAPTQSVSVSTVGFVAKSFNTTLACDTDGAYHCMKQDITDVINNKSFSSCQAEFCHVSVTFNPDSDEIKFYLDGINVTTSSLMGTFGTAEDQMPKIPTFKKTNSFEYNKLTVGDYADASLQSGPKNDSYFTPWILGGGYTDGMSKYGNFMGGQFGGIISGLRGYLGSFKLYKKPLSNSEVLNNFNAQKQFFKNIDLT